MQPGNTQRMTVPRLMSFLVLCCGLGSAAAQAQSSSADKPDKIGPPTAVPALKGLEGVKLPSDAIIVVCEQAADALRQLPRFIVIAPEKLKEMQDEIDRLKAKPRQEKPVLPSLLHIEGRVEGEVVHFDVRYELETDRPGALLALGCKQARLRGASLDGRAPLIRVVEGEGFVANVENKGKAQLTAQYSLPLTASGATGATRTLDLDLPHAAGTTIKLHIGDVKDMRVNDRALDNPLLTWRGGWLEGSLDPVPAGKLTITWKGSSAAPGGPAVLTAEGHIQVRVDRRQLSTEAVLDIKVQGGQTNVWKLLVPLQSQLKLKPADEGRITIETRDFPNASLRTLRMKEPSSEPLTVTVEASQPVSPRSGARLGIGPFALLGATRQTGTGVISSEAGNLLLHTHLPASRTTTLVPPKPDDLKGSQVHAFSYVLPPLSDNPPFVDKNGTLSLLEVEAETVRGRIETRVSHVFRLPRKENAEDQRFWMVQTTIEARLLQPGVEQLVWQLPPDWRYVGSEQRPGEPRVDVESRDKDPRIVLRPAREPWKTFQIALRQIRTAQR